MNSAPCSIPELRCIIFIEQIKTFRAEFDSDLIKREVLE